MERFEFHLNEFQRVVSVSPMIPPHAVTGHDPSCVVVAVQVGFATTTVPPSSFPRRRTRY